MKEGEKKTNRRHQIIRFRLFFSSSLFPCYRTCADSACSASAAVVDRRRPSCMAARGGIFYRGGDIWEERECRENKESSDFFFLLGRSFATSSAKSELRHNSFLCYFFPFCFGSLSVFRRVVPSATPLELSKGERNARCLADSAR